MSWSYSQALVAEYLGRNCLDTQLFALSSMTPTPDQYYWPDKTTEHSRLFRFGMTLEHLTESLGAELLMLFQEDSRAKTLALPDQGPDWTAKGQGYGEKWLGLLARFDQVSCSLKTVQCSLFEGLTECFQTLPRSGLMLGGELFPQPMLERITSANESGFLPTPVSIDSGSWRFNTSIGSSNKRPTLAMMARKNLWPTPCASDDRDRGNSSTPAIKRRIEKGKQVMLSMCVSSENGRLNPDWVEWLMGWPIGHTDLKPLGTGRFLEFVQQHGNCFMESEEAA